MKRTFAPLALALIASLASAGAAEPIEILKCTSNDAILSISKSGKHFLASLVIPMTAEKIRKLTPNLSESMVNLLLAEKPVNQIPAEYREYDSFEISDATVKNGFTLSAKNVHLSLVQNENERIDILFAYEKTSRSMHEKRSGTLPLGPSSEVACEWIESP